MVIRYGWDVADMPEAYTQKGYAAEAAHGIMSGQGYDPSVPDLELLHAIPNGGHRDKVTAAKLKAEGVKAGIPDVFLPVARSFGVPGGPVTWYHGLYVELKRPKVMTEGKRGRSIVGKAAGSTQDEQDTMIARLRKQGYAVSVCFGWEAAAADIKKYMTGC